MIQFELVYPCGGVNKYWEPLDIEAKFPTLAPFTIVARTHTRDGMRMEIFIADFGETPSFKGKYWHTAMDPFYEGDIFRDIRETYHLYCELTGKNPHKLAYTEFERLIKAVRTKCEGRYGNLNNPSRHEKRQGPLVLESLRLRPRWSEMCLQLMQH